ncbi:hypothetical protein HH308_24540 [Gordonia sp. TBRC 11910]|uniref:Uncharacterized protein n=1 Tax=Gordonia asplenii TaxID=2725283 RepID=A0A848L1R4_9ACTN|nr:hypothetical protein [Gordonia asplenii]NMO04392.1 hypothetical protein [Gordonia asplenii]
MSSSIVRPALLTALLITAAVLAPVSSADAKPAAPQRELAPQVTLADWYGTAHAVEVGPSAGFYSLTRNGGMRTVVLEERSVTVAVITRAGQQAPVRRATPWHRLAVAPPNGLPAVGQWNRSAHYNGKQFRLCRLAVPHKGRECTAYSGIIVGL